MGEAALAPSEGQPFAGDVIISPHLIACAAGHRICGSQASRLASLIMPQAVKHEAPITSPSPSDGLIDAGACRRVIKMSVGPLVWRLISR